MPYKIEQRADKFVVVRENGGQVVGTHSSRAKATAQVRALYVNVKDVIEKAMSRSEAGKYAAEQRWKDHVPATNAIANNQDRWEPAEYDGSLDGLLPKKNISPEIFDIETLKSKKISGLTIYKIRNEAGGKVVDVIGEFVSPKNGKTYGIESSPLSGDTFVYEKGKKTQVGKLTIFKNHRGEGEHEIFEAQVVNAHLRKGLATAMLETAKETLGGIVHHSDVLSEDGSAWVSATPFDKAKFGSRSEAGKYAAHIRWMRERGMEPLTPDAWRSQNAQPVEPTRSSYESSLDAIRSFATGEFQSRLLSAGDAMKGRAYDGGRTVPVGEYLNIQNEMAVVNVGNPNPNNDTQIKIGSPPLMAVEREVNGLGELVDNAILERMKQDGHILPNGEFNTAEIEALSQVRDESQDVVDEVRAKAKELGLHHFTGFENGAQTEEIKLGWREDPRDVDTSELSPRMKKLHENWDTLYQEFNEIPWRERDANVAKRERLTAAKEEYEKVAVAEFETWFNANHNPLGSGSHKEPLTKIVANHNKNLKALWGYPNYVDRYAESFSAVMEDLNISAKSQIGTSNQIDLSRSRLTQEQKTKFATDIHTFFPAKAIKIFSDKYGSLKVTKSKGGGHWMVDDAKILTDMSESTNIHEFMHALTFADSRAQFVERAFLMRRQTVGGRNHQTIKERIVNGWERPKQTYDGGRGKRFDSLYIRDEFEDQYTGRFYISNHTETMSTGVDRLSEGGTGIEDQDHINTVLGLLVAIGLGQ